MQNRSWNFLVLFIAAILWFGLSQSGCKRVSEGVPPKIAAAIDSVRQIYCPDRRLSVFDIHVEVRGKNVTLTGEVDQPAAISALSKATKAADRDFKVELNLKLLPDAELHGKTVGIILSSVANLRSKPAYSAELSSQLLLGTEIKVLKHKDGWFYVQGEDGYLGWLNGVFFQWGDRQLQKRWHEKPRYVFTNLSGKIYEKPSTRSMVVSDLVGGAVVQKIGASRNWLKVQLPDQRQGYVQKQFLRSLEKWETQPMPDGRKIVRTALRFHGLPYLWGGTSPKAVDCSGFTQTVFKWNGIRLLRDASQQFRQGVAIDPGRDFENLRPGDLVFFGPKKNKIVHVGIYMGDMQYIHSSGRVKINSFDRQAKNFSEYRYKTFVGARRILENKS
ncbi:MAG: glycoside hydrolase [Calditrichaeota bacterium]|nr:MAG: glycoside hydrolase [Calditrichota bacterium]